MKKFVCSNSFCRHDIFITGRQYFTTDYGFSEGNIFYQCMKCGKIYKLQEFMKLGE